MPKPWYVEGFGEHYLELYAHRNEREAELAMALLARVTPPLTGQRVLDLGCGGGRHLAALGRRGAHALGLDLSWPLLDAARGRLRPGLHLLRGDMRRLPLADCSVDGAVSMFTSFGYFARDEENWQVPAEVARVLAPGGWFFFDFFNRAQLERSLEARGVRESRHWRAEEERSIEADRVVKRVAVRPLAGGETVHYEESVRLFTPDELVDGFARLGLAESGRWGDYRGGAFDPERSARLILLLTRAAS
ncbi:MAG: class I SAM-dependent methyltransferase [Candidatus Krumholzibacteriia bacterium]